MKNYEFKKAVGIDLQQQKIRKQSTANINPTRFNPYFGRIIQSDTSSQSRD